MCRLLGLQERSKKASPYEPRCGAISLPNDHDSPERLAQPTQPQVGEFGQAYRAEHEAALLYRALARTEKDALRRKVLLSLASEEARHAAHWSARLARAGKAVPEQQLSFRSRLLIWCASRFGTRAIAPFLATQEGIDASRYNLDLHHPEIRLDERRHAQVVRALGRGDPNPLAAYPWSESDGFNLRAAIFGVNDGLVSNLGLTAGLAGAQVDPRMIVLGGAAGLLAGALSMAGGEYLSVRSQYELMARQSRVRQMELEAAPGHARRLLASTYEARGLPPDEARRIASAVLAGSTAAGHPAAGLGSPIAAALSSFSAFAAGAAIPLIPYLVVHQFGLPLSIVASGLVLAAVGGLLGILSHRNPVLSAARMLGIGAMAAVVTYAAGTILDLAA